jgi:chromosomal replication initiator protein
METIGAELWERTLDRLKATIDEESFVTWLRPTTFHSFSGQTLTINVPSIFYRKWLVSNYLEKIKEAVQSLTDEQDIRIAFIPSATQPEEPGQETEEISPSSTATSGIVPERELRASQLNRKYTFENFVVGESNRFAHAAAMAVADPQSKAYNPLFIYGGVGLGKTHLMQAIGHRLLSNDGRLRVRYVTSEQFMNAFIDAITQNRQFEFRNHYRNVDLLLIDDVQFFIGKQQTQTEFFHTFNALFEAGKKIAVSSDRPPKELATLEERLRSRFEWGLIVDIQPPDLELRIAILKKKAAAAQLELPNEVTIYIAERIQSNIRELEGVLVRLKAYSMLHSTPINLELTKKAVGHLLTGEARPGVSVEAIQNAVCEYFDLKLGELLGNSRLKKNAMPRHIAQYLTRSLTTLSLPEIGAKFGGRDHTSILHACKKIEKALEEDQNLKNLLNYLTKKINDKS